MTNVKIENYQQLPQKVQNTFSKLKFKNVAIQSIYKTDRSQINGELYSFRIQRQIGTSNNVECDVFINGEGLLFEPSYTIHPNDPVNFWNLPESHFTFIKEKYPDSEIKGYVNNAGQHNYFICQEGLIKYILLIGEDETYNYFWRNTSYEIDIHSKIPENVLNHLDPNFNYTNIYRFENNESTQYLFVDGNSDDKLGYFVQEK